MAPMNLSTKRKRTDKTTEIKLVLARAACCVRAGLPQPCRRPLPGGPPRPPGPRAAGWTLPRAAVARPAVLGAGGREAGGKVQPRPRANMAEVSNDQSSGPAVKEVCRDSAVLEDHTLAHSLQEQEIEHHLASNVQRNRLVQHDLQVAKQFQEEDLKAQAQLQKRYKDL